MNDVSGCDDYSLVEADRCISGFVINEGRIPPKFFHFFVGELKSNGLCSHYLPGGVLPARDAEFHPVWNRDQTKP